MCIFANHIDSSSKAPAGCISFDDQTGAAWRGTAFENSWWPWQDPRLGCRPGDSKVPRLHVE